MHHLNHQDHKFQQAEALHKELQWRLNILRTKSAEPDQEPDEDQIIGWFKRVQAAQKPLSYKAELDGVKTLNQHFSSLFPDQTSQFGQAVLEVAQRENAGQFKTTAICLNHDFFAGALSDAALGLDIIYYESEMQFYYMEPLLNIYKPTSPEKLQNLYRALILRSANILKDTGAKFNIWSDFRSDKTARTVVSRAKSILAADQSFFSATSPHQRIKGIELHERIARRFVDDLLTCAPGQTLLLTDAFAKFCALLKENSLEPVKRAEFRDMVVPLIKSQFEVCLRNDLKIDERQGVRGWKNLAMNQT